MAPEAHGLITPTEVMVMTVHQCERPTIVAGALQGRVGISSLEGLGREVVERALGRGVTMTPGDQAIAPEGNFAAFLRASREEFVAVADSRTRVPSLRGATRGSLLEAIDGLTVALECGVVDAEPSARASPGSARDRARGYSAIGGTLFDFVEARGGAATLCEMRIVHDWTIRRLAACFEQLIEERDAAAGREAGVPIGQ